MSVTELKAPNYHTLEIPPAERIAVEKGDIIGVLFDDNRLGVPFDLCGVNPENEQTYFIRGMTAETAEIGRVYGFDYWGGYWLCRIFSFRAVVTQVMLQLFVLHGVVAGIIITVVGKNRRFINATTIIIIIGTMIAVIVVVVIINISITIIVVVDALTIILTISSVINVIIIIITITIIVIRTRVVCWLVA